MSPSSRCGGPTFESPGRGGGRRGPGGSGRVAPGPLPAPHRAPQLGPQFPQLLRSGAVPHQRHQDSVGISRNSLSGPRASCRLTQLRCWVVPGRDSSSSASSGRRVTSLHSKVEFNLAAIPPHLRRGEPRRKCSGRPGHGRPGRWRRQCPSSRLCVRCFAPATNPCCPPQTARFRPHQRCSVLLLFEGLCLFAFTLVPRSTVSATLTPLGRSGPGR